MKPQHHLSIKAHTSQTNQSPQITNQSMSTHHKPIKIFKSPTNQCPNFTNQSKSTHHPPINSTHHQPIKVHTSQTNQSSHITYQYRTQTNQSQQTKPHIFNQSNATAHKLIKDHGFKTCISQILKAQSPI